jgi:hypothetical protein
MFSYSTGYYVSPPIDQYLKFKNRCSLLYNVHIKVLVFRKYLEEATIFLLWSNLDRPNPPVNCIDMLYLLHKEKKT